MLQSSHSPLIMRLSSEHQLTLLGEGLLVGVVAGAIVTLYRIALSFAERLLRSYTTMAAGNVLAVVGWIVILCVIFIAVCKLMIWEPNSQGSGIPQTDAEVMGRLSMPWHRVLGSKFLEGILCALAGLSLGREGPSVQLGSMAGKGVSRIMSRKRGEERLLVTCGAAAGMSAAFNAPFTGVLFALEEIHKEFTPTLILTVMASSVASDFLVSQILGVQPVLHLIYLANLPRSSYLFVVVLGVICGVVGALHNLGMFACQEQFYNKIVTHVPYARIAIPFVLAAFVAFLAPDLLCGGDAIVEMFQESALLPLGTILFLLLGKYLFTSFSFGSGAPGGTLFPLVVLSMLVGELYGVIVTQMFGMPNSYATNFVVMAVAGMFASVIQAPVTGVVLAFELTGNLDALLSVSIVSITSYAIVRSLHVDAFYEHLLANLLGASPRKHDAVGLAGEKVLHTYHVGANSMLDGKRIRDIVWPKTVRIVSISRAGLDIIPRGEVRLYAMDELLLLMSVEDEFESQRWAHNVARGALQQNKIQSVGAVASQDSKNDFNEHG